MLVEAVFFRGSYSTILEDHLYPNSSTMDVECGSQIQGHLLSRAGNRIFQLLDIAACWVQIVDVILNAGHGVQRGPQQYPVRHLLSKSQPGGPKLPAKI